MAITTDRPAGDPDFLVASDDDLRAAVHNALERLQLSWDELADQARRGAFSSDLARLTWKTIRDLGGYR